MSENSDISIVIAVIICSTIFLIILSVIDYFIKPKPTNETVNSVIGGWGLGVPSNTCTIYSFSNNTSITYNRSIVEIATVVSNTCLTPSNSEIYIQEFNRTCNLLPPGADQNKLICIGEDGTQYTYNQVEKYYSDIGCNINICD